MGVVTDQRMHDVLAEYDRALAGAPLAAQSRRAYRSRVAGYLRWLLGVEVGPGDPLGDPVTRDHAVAAYLAWLKSAREAKPTTINAILTALDHFYTHLRLGGAQVDREEQPSDVPRILGPGEQAAFLRVVEQASARDRAIAYTLLFTGVRVAELVALDLDDLRLRGRKRLIVWESRGRGYREIPLADEPEPALRAWLDARDDWPKADRTPAFFVNRRGGRLSTRSVDDLVVRLGRAAGIGRDDPVTPHVLRHTYGARLLRAGADLEHVSQLLGHKRIDTTRRFLAALEAG